MRIFSLIFCLGISAVSFADGVDRVKIFLNNKLVTSTLERDSNSTTINFHTGDTLMFAAWTDWGGLNKATLDIIDGSGKKIITLEKYPDRQYGAKFFYILDKALNNKKLKFVLNYDSDTKLKQWDFVKMTFKLSDYSNGQEKKFVEEIALYHLDSLTKIDKEIKYFRYFTNGYVTKKQTTLADTSQLFTKSLSLKSIFKKLTIIENKDLKSFSVPKKIGRDSKDPGLSIYRFIKYNDQLYILFKAGDNSSSGEVLIILNKNGDLVRYKYMLGQY